MKYILYTEEEGGDFHIIHRRTQEEIQKLFDDTVKNKMLIYSMGDGDRIVKIRPTFITIVEEVEGFDFVIGKTRMKKEGNAK